MVAVGHTDRILSPSTPPIFTTLDSVDNVLDRHQRKDGVLKALCTPEVVDLADHSPLHVTDKDKIYKK